MLIATGRKMLEDVTPGPIEWGNSLSTRSAKWGVMWRVDFTESLRKLQWYPTRATCWWNSEGGFGMRVDASENKGKLELK